MNIKHIIWDWNGTLLNDRWLSVAAINAVLTRYHIPKIDEARYIEIFCFPVIDYYQRLGFDFNINPFEIVGTEFIHEYEAKMFEAKLFDSAVETLEWIYKAGISQSILSAGKQKMLDDLMRFHGIGHYFKKIVGQNNHYAFGKSEAGRNWIKELGIDPENVLMVGDTVHDADVAREMGVSCALIVGGHASKATLSATENVVFDNMKNFLLWLKNETNRNSG